MSRTDPIHDGGPQVRRSAASTVASLFASQARTFPRRIAAEQDDRVLTYAELDNRAAKLAGLLAERGVGQGDRVGILSENRLEYLEIFLAAARLGAIAACQNWRLSEPELRHCLDLVEPVLVIVSPRFGDILEAAGHGGSKSVMLGPDYERALDAATPQDAPAEIDPEDPLLIIYTSGTTGLPKGAVISHRAEIARSLVIRAEFGVAPTDTFVAWSPLYHMGAADTSLSTLMSGGKVIVVDGYREDALVGLAASEELGWLILMPGMVASFIEAFKKQGKPVRSVRICGVMADLVPPSEVAEVTKLLNAPYANTFGATETGCPPGAASPLAIGREPASLSKQQSPSCEVRLVDADDNDVPDGSPGELCMRGPTLFSGYWRAPEVNGEEFRGGWFHMGDVFVRNPDRSFDFVDRVKYLIKSGGENIYPAEIERVMMQDPRVADVAVVRRPDDKWGEVPVAFVARRDDSLTADDLYRTCRAGLAGYKQPKDIRFIRIDDFPRSASGKIQRHELEARL